MMHQLIISTNKIIIKDFCTNLLLELHMMHQWIICAIKIIKIWAQIFLLSDNIGSTYVCVNKYTNL
jgi:hypothetical protein